ncbi:MAG: SdiA-regulated domain-containing protein [Bacteroidales bacterium]|nr:SdiA-regulated domain-containing protein [Bacteroidales bacterium]
MKHSLKLLFFCTLILSACVPERLPGTVAPPFKQEDSKPEETPGQQPGDESGESSADQPENIEGMPVMVSRTIMKVDVEELSGLCLTLDKSALLACGDQGIVKKITFTGDVSAIWQRDADMEDITIDPNTGHIYIAIEYSQKVYRLSAPGYTKHESIIYVQEAIDKGYDNSGLEGISYYKDDMLFVGSQWGANLWIYKYDGTKVSKISLSGFADEIAGLCYDPVADWLWVVDSNLAKIFICTVDGELLATYDLGSVSNAESICVDRDNSCVWIGSDESSPKLYKYSFQF